MRFREPAAVVVLVALGLELALILVIAMSSGAPIEVTGLPLAYYLADPALLVLLTALVAACWVVDPTRHARGVTLAALVLTAGTLAAAGAFAVAGLVMVPAEGVLVPLLVRVVPPLAAGVVALGTSIVLLRRPRPAPAPVPELAPAEPEPEPVDPQQQPTWTPDAAVGAVWRRAGDAASQTPSTSWDSPGPSGGGWGPTTSPDTPAEPTRRAGE